ncbi:TniB family NTP-binding protein [Thalassospira tepidiphila]|uniref:TniB family NTP-binding protein n=1 Tax=Thalassospira tepidiphila TaxID=393657 RepID=UPI002920BC06|nr:transposition protein TniB [Thalassospira tepidiphila]
MTKHLHPEALRYLNADNDAKLHWIRSRKWLSYDIGNSALDEVEMILNHPPTHRIPSMLLVGQTNNGKTMILEEALQRHPPESDPTAEADRIPLLFLTMPPGPELRRFYTLLLDHIGAVFKPSDTLSRLETQVLTLLKAVGTRAIVIDELHNILGGRFSDQRQFLNMLRFLSNELRISIIAAGTKNAVRVVQSDDQLANRFKLFSLPEWRDGRDFRKFLFLLEATLPFPEPSNLYKSDLARTILTVSERTIGEMIMFVTEAAGIAIQENASCLTAEHFAAANYISPSRRAAAAQEIVG